ncbi:MAG: hypothetical protein PUF65_09150 [Lachnospiraceae bacterium]|nr:hypothetical protein [Lachnospiraceae bacterium]
MEKTWETFWQSGKVSDYLTYRDGMKDTMCDSNNQRQEKRRDNGTVRNCDGNGFDSHAH